MVLKSLGLKTKKDCVSLAYTHTHTSKSVIKKECPYSRTIAVYRNTRFLNIM